MKMIGVGTKYKHNIRSTVGRVFTYHFSIEDFRDVLIKTLTKQLNDIQTILQEYSAELKALRTEINALRSDQHKNADKIKDLVLKFVRKIPKVRNQEQIAQQITDNLIAKNLKAEIEIGHLSTYSDGTIRYKGTVIMMRDQMNDLCRMFMSRPNQLVLCDEIRDEIIRAERRERTRFSTIAKYVSELHGLLKGCFGKDVIFNHKKEGWRFVP